MLELDLGVEALGFPLVEFPDFVDTLLEPPPDGGGKLLDCLAEAEPELLELIIGRFEFSEATT